MVKYLQHECQICRLGKWITPYFREHCFFKKSYLLTN